MKDYYTILGVSRNATEQDIKQAYRRLARKYHPDVNPGNRVAEAHFKEINEAHEVLSDREKRAQYDRFGNSWRRYQQANPYGRGAEERNPFRRAAGANRGTSRPQNPDPFMDFFDAIFGSLNPDGHGQSGHTGSDSYAGVGSPGQDVERTVDITLEEAFHGTQRSIRTVTPDGVTRKIVARIPPGADTGTRIRISGEGSPGSFGGKRGDLLLVTRVLAHTKFERSGHDLATILPADIYTLLLGGAIKLTTITGQTIALTIHPNTPNGKIFRLSRQGMPHLNQTHERGDLYVTVMAELPTTLSSRERELFEELRRIRSPS